MSQGRTSEPLKAVLWMMGALASFTTMAISARELSAELGVFQIAAVRSIFCVAVLLPFAMRGGFDAFKTTRLRLHLFRNTIHFGGQVGWFYGITLLPLAAVFSIEFTVPIWTAILAAIFLREKMTWPRAVSVILGFTGILLIVRPGSDLFQVASFTVLAGAFCYAATYVFTRHMTTTESPLTMIVYMNLIQMPLGIIPASPDWVWPSLTLFPWIVAIGIAGLTSHWCVAHAFKHADATIVAPMDFIRLPLIAVVGYLVYAEPWNPWVLIGGVVIFSGNLINIWGERRRAA